jgi:hypothetical protein
MEVSFQHPMKTFSEQIKYKRRRGQSKGEAVLYIVLFVPEEAEEPTPSQRDRHGAESGLNVTFYKHRAAPQTQYSGEDVREFGIGYR